MSKEQDVIRWLFNQPDARKAVPLLGARNLTEVCTVIAHSAIDFEELESYSKMVMYSSQQADQELINWMKEQIEKYKSHDKYIYFRFKRLN